MNFGKKNVLEAGGGGGGGRAVKKTVSTSQSGKSSGPAKKPGMFKRLFGRG